MSQTAMVPKKIFGSQTLRITGRACPAAKTVEKRDRMRKTAPSRMPAAK
jgi:hypothetical protein